MAEVKGKESTAKTLKYQADKDRELVKGIFRFFEAPGGNLSFVYCGHKGDVPTRYDLVDGEIHSLPLGVAKHLNKNGWVPVHAHQRDKDGKPSVKIGKKIQRFTFESLEFVDDEELYENNPDIVTIEKV